MQQQATAFAAKAQPGADGGEQDPGDRRTDQAAELEDRGVHADRVPQVARAHELVDEDLAGRLVQHGDQAQDQGDHVDVPDLDPLAERQHGEDRRQHRGHGLAQHEDLPLREAVRHHAGPRAEEQRGKELQRHGDADGGDGTGELEHQPVLGDPLHPERDRRR